jgi:hypothetical protein
MEILHRFIPSFIFLLVPDIPIGFGMRFVGEIPFKIKIAPSDTVAFLPVTRTGIFEDFVDRTVGYQGADPEICITGNSVGNKQVSVKRNGLLNDDIVNPVDP